MALGKLKPESWQLIALRENRLKGGKLLLRLTYIGEIESFDRYTVEFVGISEETFAPILKTDDRNGRNWEYEKLDGSFCAFAPILIVSYWPDEKELAVKMSYREAFSLAR